MRDVQLHGRLLRVQSSQNIWQDTETLEFMDPTADTDSPTEYVLSITQRGEYGSTDVTVNTHGHEIEIDVLSAALDYARHQHGLPPRASGNHQISADRWD